MATARGSVKNMDHVNQALYLGIAALAARIVSPTLLDGLEAPTLTQLSIEKHRLGDLSLCEYGDRREHLGNQLLEATLRKCNESGAFTNTSERSIAALCLAETLLLCE